MGWLNEKSHLKGLFDTYDKFINLLQLVATIYCAKCGCLVRFCNNLTKEVPWRMEDALEDADENITRYSILRFVYLCERMMKRFKAQLKEHNEKRVI